MDHLWTPAKPKFIPPSPLPQPLVPHIVRLADEIDEKKMELAALLQIAEQDEIRRFEHLEKIEYGKMNGSVHLPTLDNFNENED